MPKTYLYLLNQSRKYSELELQAYAIGALKVVDFTKKKELIGWRKNGEHQALVTTCDVVNTVGQIQAG